MDYEFVRQRITELRIKKGVAEYRMSLDMGHSRNYIQNISSGKSKPSMEEFLYICDYLGVHPRDFFDEENPEPILLQQALDGLRTLTPEQLQALIPLIDILNTSHTPKKPPL